MEEDVFEGFPFNDPGISSSQAANATLRSTGYNNVYLVKPQDDKFFLNPIEIAKTIHHQFSKLQIDDVRTNKRKKILVIELKPNVPNNEIDLKI